MALIRFNWRQASSWGFSFETKRVRTGESGREGARAGRRPLVNPAGYWLGTGAPAKKANQTAKAIIETIAVVTNSRSTGSVRWSPGR